MLSVCVCVGVGGWVRTHAKLQFLLAASHCSLKNILKPEQFIIFTVRKNGNDWCLLACWNGSLHFKKLSYIHRYSLHSQIT